MSAPLIDELDRTAFGVGGGPGVLGITLERWNSTQSTPLGNLAALEAIVAKLGALKPDQVAILGDHALFGPKPTETIDLIRKLQSNGALVTAGTGDIAVADLDYAASFPSLAGGLPPGLKAARCSAPPRAPADH